MNKEEYIDEIQLIQEQNDTEFEIYPLVSEIITPTLQGLSKRYVFARRISLLGKIYFGFSSFPDIAILDRDFRNDEHKEIKISNWNKLKGCVEVKAYNKSLYNLDSLKDYIQNQNIAKNRFKEVAQLIGEILWYKKVLYTNGVQWKLFTFNPNDNDKEIIIEIVSKIHSQKYDWWENPNILKMINNKIKEETITDNCIDSWDNFILKINRIDWKK